MVLKDVPFTEKRGGGEKFTGGKRHDGYVNKRNRGLGGGGHVVP